jgi:putative ABC transport system permease protein
MTDLLYDLRHALRTIIKTPSFAVVVILTLSLAIGINTSIFSLLNGILLQPLPYSEPGKLVSVWNKGITVGGFVAFQQHSKTLDIGAFGSSSGWNLSGNGDAIRLVGNEVSSNLFTLLGVRPQMGRVFHPGDELPGKNRLVILSNSLWQTKFGGNKDIIGRSILLNDAAWEVIGVMPQEFNFPSPSTQIWVPIEVNPATMWGSFQYNLIGRLRTGMNLETARAEFKAVLPQVIAAFPWPMGNWGSGADIALLQRQTVANVQTTLYALMGAVALILLVACVNLANLFLARSARRKREIAVRMALGASGMRITRQLLTECLLLALVGGAVACGIAFLGLKLLKSMFPPDTARLPAVHIDGSVLLFTTAVSVICGLVFGLVPAFQTNKPDIDQVLRTQTNAAGIPKTHSRLSAVLVVFQVAVAIVLSCGAGLLIKSLWLQSQIRTGFNPEHLITAHIAPSDSFCKSNNSCLDFYKQVLERVQALPGIKAASVAETLPLDGVFTMALAVKDYPAPASGISPYVASFFIVDPGYLNTMQLDLLRGRNFSDADRANTPAVVLVSKSLAQKLWPGQDPLGKLLRPSWVDGWRTVIGLVDDVQRSTFTPGKPSDNSMGDIYFPVLQGIAGPPTNLTLAVRADGDMSILGAEISEAVKTVNPAIPITEVRTMHEVIYKAISSSRITTWLFAGFASLALLIGLIGIYSVISYSVVRRRHEIGIRRAVGASNWAICKMILNYGLILTLSGIVLGVLSGLALTRLMRSLLYDVHPNDPLTFFAVSFLIAVSACLATLIPARQALRVDPMNTLKSE